MSRVSVKICGVTSVEEALEATEFGVDALGFNFWPGSPRYITPDRARVITSFLPPFVTAVGVFVNEDAGRIKEIISKVGLNAVQLHGDEPPEFCAQFRGVKTIKAFRVGQQFDAESVRPYDVSAVLLDTKVPGSYGGTGKSFNWQAALDLRRVRTTMILAGGITLENVREAMTTVAPMAIDVCSGVEAEPGVKDLNKLRRFLVEVDRVNASFAGVFHRSVNGDRGSLAQFEDTWSVYEGRNGES
jgi:phosphoribosylanthranilate isomerase